jgi:parvulin-like peptidyl-prolyl isomerase
MKIALLINNKKYFKIVYMKKKLFIFIIIAILLFPYCKDKKKIENSKNNSFKKTETNVEKKVLILKIGDNPFYDKDFLEYLKRNIGDSYKQLPPTVIDKLFNNFLNDLFVYVYAKEQGIEVSSKEIKFYLKKIKLDNLDNSKLKPFIMRRMIIEKYISQILSSINISDNEIKSYYYKNPKLFKRPSEIRLSQIVVKDEKEALDIRAQLKRDKTLFPKLAQEKSIGSEKNSGGDMGYFSRGQLPKDIERVVFSLNTGEISQVVKSPYGFHIFMVTKKKKKRLMALQYVSSMIKLKIKQIKFEKRWNEIINKARKTIPIVLYNENLDKFKKNIFKPDNQQKGKTNEEYNKKRKGE